MPDTPSVPQSPAPVASSGSQAPPNADPTPHLEAINTALSQFQAAGKPADLAPQVKQFVQGHYQALAGQGYFNSAEGQPIAQALRAQGFVSAPAPSMAPAPNNKGELLAPNIPPLVAPNPIMPSTPGAVALSHTPTLPYLSPVGDAGQGGTNAAAYIDPNSKTGDPLGHAMLSVDQTAKAYQSAPGPQTEAAHRQAITQAVNVLQQSGAAQRTPMWAQWVQGAKAAGWANAPATQGTTPPPSGVPANGIPDSPGVPAQNSIPATPGPVWNTLDALGLEGREGAVHKGLDQFGQNIAANVKTLGQSASRIPDALLQGAGDMLSSMYGTEADSYEQHQRGEDPGTQRVGHDAQNLVNGVVQPIVGPQSLLGHGYESAKQGPQAFGNFTEGVPAGIGQEAFNHPIDEALNVLSMVGGGELALGKGAEGILTSAGRLSKAADAAESARNASRAASLRQAAQAAQNMGEDLKVAATNYHRAATGGPVGDYAANTAATLARKYFPGAPVTETLTQAAMNRSLGKAVSEAYGGYRARRSQAQGRVIPQPGDVNVGSEGVNVGSEPPSSLRSFGAGNSPVFPRSVSLSPRSVSPGLPALAGQTRPALTPPPPLPLSPLPGETQPRIQASPAPSIAPVDPRGYAGWMHGESTPQLPVVPQPAQTLPRPPAAPQPAPRSSVPLLPAPPVSPAGKYLHPTVGGVNGAGRHSDGTFAPQRGADLTSPDMANWENTDWRTRGIPQAGDGITLTPDQLLSHVQQNGGKVGAVVWDRTRLGKYIPRDPRSGIDINLHGGPRTPFNSGWNGKAGAAVSSASQGTVLHSLADKTGGTTLVVLGDHAMSLGNMEYHGVYHAETQHQIKQGLLKPEDLDSVTQGAAASILKTDPKAFKGKPITSWADYQNAAPGLSFDVRNRFQKIVGGPLAAKYGTVPHQDVLAGFNDYHDVPTGHVVAALHIHPGQGKAKTAEQLGVTAHPSYPYASGGYGLGDFDKPFPASLVFDKPVRDYAAVNGKSYNGNPSSLNYWLPRGYVSATGLDSGIIKGIKSHQNTIADAAPNGSEGVLNGNQSDGNHAGSNRTFVTTPADHTGHGNSRSASGYGSAFPSGDLSRRLDLAGDGAGGRLGAGSLESSQSRGSGNLRPATGQALYRPNPVISPEGVQAVFRPGRGANPPKVYLSPEAVRSVMTALGSTSQSPRGFALNADNVQRLHASNVAPHVLSALRQGLAATGGHGVNVTTAAEGSTLSSTVGNIRHEATHVLEYKYPLSAASLRDLDTRLTQEARAGTPLGLAGRKFDSALARNGYAPEKFWFELPSIVAGKQWDKAGLTEQESKMMLRLYAVKVAEEHGDDAALEILRAGSRASRSLAPEFAGNAAASPAQAKRSLAPTDTAPDQSKFQDITRFIGPPRLLSADEIADVRKAGLLSSPKQVVKAVAGHVGAMGSDELARLPAAAIDFLVSAATGKDRTVGNIRLQDLTAAARKGATEGVKLGFTVLRHGSHGLASRGMSHPLLPANHPDFHTGMGLLDTYVNGVFRMHEGAYAALRVFALHRAMLELAHLGSLNAVRRGLVPKAQQEALRQHLYSQPSPAMMGAAISAAEEATLTNANAFSKMYQGAYDKAPAAGRFLMSQTVPFPKIESNVAGRSLEMATGAASGPIRFALQVMKKNGFTADDQRKFSMTFGRGMVGLGLIALGMMIAAKKKGQASDEKRHQPGAVLYGGRSFPTNTVAPMSNLLQLGIDLMSGREQGGGAASHAGDAVANLLMEQPYLKANPGDLTEILTSGSDAKRQIGQQAGSFVPSILADVAAQQDPYKRKQSEPLDFVKNRVPGLRQTLSPAKDLLGNPRLESPNRLINPFGGTPLGAADSPALQALMQARRNTLSSNLSPGQQAQKTLSQGILDQAAQGKDIRPFIQSALDSHQLTLPAARRLIAETRLTPLQQKMEMLPLGSALDVYALGNPSEKAQWQPVLLRKLAGAARARALTPEMMQKVQALGIGVR